MTEIEMMIEADEAIEMETEEVIQNGGGGGTQDYNMLQHLPQVNGVTLKGNKSLQELGITEAIGTEVDSYVQSHKAELKGDPGEQGPKGDTGAQGPEGKTGPQGPAGAAGERGPAGEKGDKGEQGPAGSAGATGPQGPKGDTGATGPAGPKGDTGEAGPQGPAGQDYEITEADYEAIANLVILKLPEAESVSV